MSITSRINWIRSYHGIVVFHVWSQKNDTYQRGIDFIFDGTCSIYETY